MGLWRGGLMGRMPGCSGKNGTPESSDDKLGKMAK